MNFVRRFTEKYYGWKYRIKEKPGRLADVAVMVRDKKREEAFEKMLNEVAAKAKPCARTKAELIEYLTETYNMQLVEVTARELEHAKVNYIMEVCPRVLSVQPMKLSTDGKPPTKDQFLAWCANREQVDAEARAYPVEKLPLNVSKYAVVYTLSSGNVVDLSMILTEPDDHWHIQASSRSGNAADQAELETILDDIDFFQGVTEEDIRTHSLRFQMYASRLTKFAENYRL